MRFVVAAKHPLYDLVVAALEAAARSVVDPEQTVTRR
jgi:hypothetical protein